MYLKKAFDYLCAMMDDQARFDFVYSPAMLELVRRSNEACLFLEGVRKHVAQEFIEQSLHHLSGVYSAFLETGDTEPGEDAEPDPTVTEQDWSELYQGIAALLGPWNEILRPANPEEFDDSELVKQYISEDMADVYQELKDFTSVYSRGVEEFMNDAAWQLKERFTEHWGTKLLRALSALHELFVKEIDPTQT